ncbi:MAG: hypothetical protein JST67_00280 [Bacteroidetes bacterium]|nr:hypothetical protein [Bacteroidota bacterium]
MFTDKKHIAFYATILAVVVLFFAFSCKKDRSIVDNNCNNMGANANFKIYERFLTDSIEADTLSASGLYRLYPNIISDSFNYKWTIKSSSYFGTSALTYLEIDNSSYNNHLPSSQTYSVTLTVSLKNRSNCNNIKEVDSISKRFYIWPCEQGNCYNGGFPTTYTLSAPVNYWPIWGSFKGQTKNDPTTVRIVTIFDTLGVIPNQSCEGSLAGQTGRISVLRNIPYNNWNSLKCSSGLSLYGSISAPSGGACETFFYTNGFTSSNCCNGGQMPYLNGKAYLDLNNSNMIIIDYQYKDTLTGILINDQFKGLRI